MGFVFSDSKSEKWVGTGNISLENHSQILEETRRIHGPVQLEVNNKTSVTMRRI